MPNRQYIPGDDPPSPGDRLLAHPYVIVFSFMAIILGGWIIGGVFFNYSVSQTLEGGPPFARVLAATPAVLGGIVTLGAYAMAWRADQLRTMALECLGVLVMAVSWGSYAILLATPGLADTPPWGVISIFLAFAHGLHGLGVILTMRRISSRAEKIKRERRTEGGTE